MTKFERERISIVNSGFVIVSSFLIRASAFSLFGAERDHRIDLGGAARRDEAGDQRNRAED